VKKLETDEGMHIEEKEHIVKEVGLKSVVVWITVKRKEIN
jgi:hypothetical protein